MRLVWQKPLPQEPRLMGPGRLEEPQLELSAYLPLWHALDPMPLVELVLPAHNYYFRLQVLEGFPLLYWDLVLDLLLLERLLALLQNCNPYHYAALDAPSRYTSVSNTTIAINFTFTSSIIF